MEPPLLTLTSLLNFYKTNETSPLSVVAAALLSSIRGAFPDTPITATILFTSILPTLAPSNSSGGASAKHLLQILKDVIATREVNATVLSSNLPTLTIYLSKIADDEETQPATVRAAIDLVCETVGAVEGKLQDKVLEPFVAIVAKRMTKGSPKIRRYR